ncbi:MAG TPA: hypothetical protein IAA45_00990 [Candidatus Blautia gallistercoris]|uniref:GCVT N-terminal domain-containing protein n=1 Tax=Candidatus Blautia gallistercoris TaxID=2838490 RepID=A0A9D2B1P5_9FIRM|nr:hypothetical protein [Candidatus Blautia gallistercoris]
MGKKLEAMGFVPLQNEVTYKNLFGNMQVWEADSWQEASLSWKKSSYIHAGISGGRQYIKGPDAQKLLSRISINDVYNWKVNRCKHLVMCDENGLIVNHALTQRNSEEEFCMYAGNPWPIIKELQTGKYNAEIIQDSCFVFQMSGTLAYEFRGPAEFGPEVYQKIWEDGQEYDLKRLGWKTYTVNHTEGGFPQMTVGFETAAVVDPVFMSVPELASVGCQKHTGSYDPADARARLRTAGEVDWLWMARFDHDFIGREALEKEKANPKRKIVNLEWNLDDIMEIYRSHFEEGEDYKMIEFPCGQPQPAGGHADIVSTHDGKVVGVSSCTLYSYYYRTLFSQCILDIDQAELGNEVLVHWGDFGKKIKKARAQPKLLQKYLRVSPGFFRFECQPHSQQIFYIFFIRQII